MVTRRFRFAVNARWLLIAAALIVAVALSAWRLLPQDSTTKVTSGQAQAEFRRLVSGDPGRDREVAGLPAPGVYRYSISGGERFDALLSASHDYSGIATILIVNRSCGFEEQWRVLEERWSSAVACPDPRGELRLSRLREHHEFFGNVEDVAYSCRSLTATDTRCSSPQVSISYSTRRIATEMVNFAKFKFRTVHFRAHAVFAGDSRGSGVIDEWRRTSDGLLLRKQVSIGAEVAGGGGGSYSERYELELLSPEPAR